MNLFSFLPIKIKLHDETLKYSWIKGESRTFIKDKKESLICLSCCDDFKSNHGKFIIYATTSSSAISQGYLMPNSKI